jgi:PleD family two-component response regulator
MPIMDGFTVLAKVKEDPNLRDIPVIIISSEQESKSVVKGIKQGAEDYLTKPVNAGLLVKKVMEYLG